MNNSDLFKLANQIRRETSCSKSEAYYKAKAKLENPVNEDPKKFNLMRAFNGSKIMTKSGKKAKIICSLPNNKLFVRIFSNISSINDTTVKYNIDGSRWSSNYPSDEDLIMG